MSDSLELSFDVGEIASLAVETLDWSNPEVRSRSEEAAVTQYLRLEKVLGKRSLLWQVAWSVRIPAVIEKIVFEESSQRYLVTFTAIHQPEDGEVKSEVARTPRCDTSRGKMYARLLGRLSPGDRVLVYKSHESGKDGRKYRLLTWVEPLN